VLARQSSFQLAVLLGVELSLIEASGSATAAGHQIVPA
jgi:hypothetical protein